LGQLPALRRSWCGARDRKHAVDVLGEDPPHDLGRLLVDDEHPQALGSAGTRPAGSTMSPLGIFRRWSTGALDPPMPYTCGVTIMSSSERKIDA
jgi:hypothetical protein